MQGDIDAASVIWRELAAGVWSVVDHWDAGGRRFAVAILEPHTPRPFDALSAHERRIMELVAAGQRDKEIADTLGVSLPAVYGTVARARKKLGATTRAELATAWRMQGKR